ncbi:MAG TPA: MarR family transcriptional regulator [Kofleriaceae bacterium]|nr:MarR family transcriptional regulator [Kofleriaceae bacterium]
MLDADIDLDFRALADFRYQLRKFLAFSEQTARAVGLEPRQHQLLLAIRGLPEDTEPTIATIAERMALRHHTVVELVDRLESAGLARRTRDPEDRRRANVTITARGNDLLRKLSLAHRDELRTSAPALVASLGRVLRSAKKA